MQPDYPDYCEGCNQRFAPIDQQSCWGCKDGDCNTSKRGLLNTALKKKIEQLDGGVVALCETYSQVNKALCGKENATLDELSKTIDQLKESDPYKTFSEFKKKKVAIIENA